MVDRDVKTALRACWYLEWLVDVATVAILEVQLNRFFTGKAYTHFSDTGNHARRTFFLLCIISL